MNKSWGTVGVLLWAPIMMGIGSTGCGSAGAADSGGDVPLAVIQQVIADGDTVEGSVVREGPPGVGHEGPGRRAGMHGAHHGFRGLLDLTDEQREEARAIREQTREEVKAVRDAAREVIHGLLTEEQLAQLEALRAERAEAREQHQAGRRHRGGRDAEGQRGMHGQRGHHFRQEVGERQRPFDSLDLTEEQQDSIEVIREGTREEIRALHDTARDSFRAILTAEQIEILDELHPPVDDPIDPPDSGEEG